MAQACESCFDNKTTQDGAEECSIFSPQEHRATNMNISTDYFEDVFATAISVQVHLLLPTIIEKMCYGCRLGSSEDFDHAVCQMSPKNFVRIGFHDALNLIDKERAELHFRTYVYPRAEYIYDQSWYQFLWTNEDWLQLVQDKAVHLRHRLMNV